MNTSLFKCCTLCPHHCMANRIASPSGFCKTGTAYPVASICAHKGEEPPISGKKGICNVFFSHCNMQCLYCQNYQISLNANIAETAFTENETIRKIESLLKYGCHTLGFVSPSHVVPQMLDIIKKIKAKGLNPIVVYNTNAYDKTETLLLVKDGVDVYLPDFKYADDTLAFELSGIINYTQTALSAVKEMLTQKGAELKINNRGEALKGVIIRHLVLPGYISNSIEVLKLINKHFGNQVYVSLMAQYAPNKCVANHPVLCNTLDEKSYNSVVNCLDDLGFENGWVQNPDSSTCYNPDFDKTHPFE